MNRKFAVVAILALAFPLAMFVVAYAAPHDPPDHPTPPPTHTPQPTNTPRPTQEEAGFQPVTLCHASPTGAGNSGQAKSYELITADNQGQLNGHLGHPNDIIPAPEGCPVIQEPTATEVPTDEPTLVSDPTSEPTATPTNLPDTDSPTATVVATEIDTTPTPGQPTAETTPTVAPTKKACQAVEVGRWFFLTGPDGQTGRLASFSPSQVNDSGYYPPNVGAQQLCLGFVSVNTQAGELIYKNCDGTYSTYCYRCQGGGPAGVYEYNGPGQIPSRARGGN